MVLEFIGLRNVTVSSSNYYVNDLPGISTELVNNVKFTDEQTTLELWESVQRRSYLRLETYISAQLADRAKLNEVILSTGNLKKYNKDKIPYISDANELRGVYLRAPESKYSSLRVNSVFVYNNGDEITDTEIKIYDANDGEELDTIEVETLSHGINEILVNKEYKSLFGITQISIVINGNFDTIRVADNIYNWYDSDSSCATCRSSDYIDIYPILTDTDTIQEESNLPRNIGKGVWVSADIICTPDNFLTRHRVNFITALLYLMGAELMKSKMGSPRINLFTASNLEYTEQLFEQFEKDWQNSAKQALKGISLTGENVCFSCEEASNIMTTGLLP